MSSNRGPHQYPHGFPPPGQLRNLAPRHVPVHVRNVRRVERNVPRGPLGHRGTDQHLLGARPRGLAGALPPEAIRQMAMRQMALRRTNVGPGTGGGSVSRPMPRFPQPAGKRVVPRGYPPLPAAGRAVGQRLYVKLSAPGLLPLNLTPADVGKHFSEFGPVANVVVHASRDWAAVDFQMPGSVQKAMSRGRLHRVKGAVLALVQGLPPPVNATLVVAPPTQRGMISVPAFSPGRPPTSPGCAEQQSRKRKTMEAAGPSAGPPSSTPTPAQERSVQRMGEAKRLAASKRESRANPGADRKPKLPPSSPEQPKAKRVHFGDDAKTRKPPISTRGTTMRVRNNDGALKQRSVIRKVMDRPLKGYALNAVHRDALDVSSRYPSLKVPEEFVKVACSWVHTCPPTRDRDVDFAYHKMVPVGVCEWLEPCEKKPAAFSMPTSDPIVVDKDSGKRIQYQAHVVLHTQPRGAETMHLYDRLQVLVSEVQFDGGRMLPGGLWSKELDGGDPSLEDRDLIATVVRCTKAICGVDLAPCARWIKLMEFKYDNYGSGGYDETRSIVFTVDWTVVVPTPGMWAETRGEIMDIDRARSAEQRQSRKRWKTALTKADILIMDGRQLRKELGSLGMETAGDNNELKLRLHRATKRTNSIKQTLPVLPSILISQPTEAAIKRTGWHRHRLVPLATLLSIRMKTKLGKGLEESTVYGGTKRLGMSGIHKTFEVYAVAQMLDELITRDQGRQLLLQLQSGEQPRALKFFDRASSGRVLYKILEEAIHLTSVEPMSRRQVHGLLSGLSGSGNGSGDEYYTYNLKTNKRA